jgi:hypothetical protein
MVCVSFSNLADILCRLLIFQKLKAVESKMVCLFVIVSSKFELCLMCSQLSNVVKNLTVVHRIVMNSNNVYLHLVHMLQIFQLFCSCD